MMMIIIMTIEDLKKKWCQWVLRLDQIMDETSLETQIDCFLEQFKRNASKAMEEHISIRRSRSSYLDTSAETESHGASVKVKNIQLFSDDKWHQHIYPSFIVCFPLFLLNLLASLPIIYFNYLIIQPSRYVQTSTNHCLFNTSLGFLTLRLFFLLVCNIKTLEM